MKNCAIPLALAAASSGVASCASCSTPDRSDGGIEASVDSSAQVDAADSSSGNTCDASWWDGGRVSDWPGWRRLTEISPCCVIDVADDAGASLPVLDWIPCSNGAGNCVELQQSWPVDNPGANFGVGRVSHDSAGAPLLMPLGFPLSETKGMVGIYAVPALTPLAAIEADNGNTASPEAHCPLNEIAAGSSLALLARTGLGGSVVATYGAPQALSTATVARTLAPPGAIASFQTSLASPTRLAFDVQPNGLVEQWPFDAGALIASSNSTGAALLLDFIEGDDVYAWSVYGNAGWMQEYRVAPDGTATLLRSKANTQISGMATDGVTLAWCESYGTSSPSQQEPNVELWSAPYTNDPTLLASTAKKIATLPFGYACSSHPAVFDGYFAETTVPFDRTVVVRLSDGVMQQIAAGAGRGFGTYAFVTSTEVWATMNVENDAGNIGFRNVAFARYTLGAWP